MSAPAALIVSAHERYASAVATARETAIALAAEREQKVNETAGGFLSAEAPAVSLTPESEGN